MLTYTVNHEEPRQASTRELLGDVPSITIVSLDANGEQFWEFDIEQRDYEQSTGLGPDIDLRLPLVQSTWVVMSCDAYPAYAEIPSFFAWLAQARPQTLDAVRAWLGSAGFTDVTRRA